MKIKTVIIANLLFILFSILVSMNIDLSLVAKFYTFIGFLVFATASIMMCAFFKDQYSNQQSSFIKCYC